MRQIFRLELILICILLFASCQTWPIRKTVEREITATVYQFYPKSYEVCVVFQDKGIDNYLNVKFQKGTFKRLIKTKHFLMLPQEKKEGNDILYLRDKELFRIKINDENLTIATNDKVRWIIDAKTNEFICLVPE